jgi:cellulose synthase/poly-beta-1,6-N-acetylglucosamine synthase-like glycosyltransferase
MRAWLLSLVAVSLALPLYAYIVYPVVLRLVVRLKRDQKPPSEAGSIGGSPAWPDITVSIPAYNEETVIGDTLENLLQVDYPRDRLQILVLSDASTDQTDEIVRGFANQGVELLRLSERVGKTEAENLSQPLIHGKIVVNTDASVRIAPDGLKPLISAFSSPNVGVASGTDVSVAESENANNGESSYVGYEMSVRALETAVEGIVGASGCYYAIRSELHTTTLPPCLSRDFVASLVAREAGYRSVSVPEAVCYVPRVGGLRHEYPRKVRTIARGLRTLGYKRHLLNPFRYGLFAWMLFSHKLCRWLVPWGGLAGLVAAGVLAANTTWARWVLAASASALVLAVIGMRRDSAGKAATPLTLLSFVVAGNAAVLHAWLRALKGESEPSWEPTRRKAAGSV